MGNQQPPANAEHHTWDDLPPGYYCVAWTPGEHYMDFRVYKYLGQDVLDRPLFQEAGAVPSPSPVEDLARASVFLSGTVKWDGCSNVRFDRQDDVMLHFCGKGEATNVGALLGRIYDLAAQLIPHWDGD